jgi:hypothetical protein
LQASLWTSLKSHGNLWQKRYGAAGLLDLILDHRASRRARRDREAALQSDQRSSDDSPFEAADNIDETKLAAVMRSVPLGAAILAGSAVALLVAGYLLVYLLVFIPRGTVG